MIHKNRSVLVLLLAASSALCAHFATAFAADREFERHPWRKVDSTMSLHEYRDTCRENQRMTRDALMSYSKRTLRSMGAPQAGIEIMGTAIGLAMHDAKFHLNSSETLALELKDITDKDRALFLGFKMGW